MQNNYTTKAILVCLRMKTSHKKELSISRFITWLGALQQVLLTLVFESNNRNAKVPMANFSAVQIKWASNNFHQNQKW